MNKIKISAVSYLNSKPFIYGLQHSENLNYIDLQLDIPSVCAQKLMEGKVDVGLIPIATIPELYALPTTASAMTVRSNTNPNTNGKHHRPPYRKHPRQILCGLLLHRLRPLSRDGPGQFHAQRRRWLFLRLQATRHAGGGSPLQGGHGRLPRRGDWQQWPLNETGVPRQPADR